MAPGEERDTCRERRDLRRVVCPTRSRSLVLLMLQGKGHSWLRQLRCDQVSHFMRKEQNFTPLVASVSGSSFTESWRRKGEELRVLVMSMYIT